MKKVGGKVKKNSSDILDFANRLKQKEDLTTELEYDASFFRGYYYYNRKSYLLYKCKKGSNDKLTVCKSSGIDNYSVNSDLKAIPDSSNLFPSLENNRRINLKFSGNYYRQDKVLHSNNNNVVNN